MVYHSQHKVRRVRCVFAVAAAAFSTTVFADSREIQVYQDALPDKGEYNLDLSSNFSKTSSQSELKGRSVLQALAEFSYGVSANLEAGLKVPVSHIDGRWYGNG